MSGDDDGSRYASPATINRRGVLAVGAMTGVAGVAATPALGSPSDPSAVSASGIDPATVQLVFADLQGPLVSGSKTQPPDRLERAAAVLAEVGRVLSIPMLFSVVMEGDSPPHLLPALKPYADASNTHLRIPVAPFHDAATREAIAARRRRILVIAGFATEVVVLQTALDAVAAGYQVYVVSDATGSQYERTEAAAFREMESAGVKPTSVLSFATRMVPDFVNTPGKDVFADLQPVLGR